MSDDHKSQDEGRSEGRREGRAGRAGGVGRDGSQKTRTPHRDVGNKKEHHVHFIRSVTWCFCCSEKLLGDTHHEPLAIHIGFTSHLSPLSPTGAPDRTGFTGFLDRWQGDSDKLLAELTVEFLGQEWEAGARKPSRFFVREKARHGRKHLRWGTEMVPSWGTEMGDSDGGTQSSRNMFTSYPFQVDTCLRA